MTEQPPRSDTLMQAYLLFIAVGLMPIALSYGVEPAHILPKALNISVEGADQTQIFRALMGLYLGCSAFWAIAAFKPDWQRVAVIFAVFFMVSLAAGRTVSLLIDGPASRLLDLYLILEIFAGVLGLIVLAYGRNPAARR
jgi:hypothetical protein